MEPVRVKTSNFTYLGPSPDIGDLPCHRDGDGGVFSVWEPTPDERRQIAEGANVEVGVFQEPMPPISVKLNTDERDDG